ncbi:MAG: hypothetical protein HXS46_10590 [Theionarchaea archaeon]|nr:hypothetical protein [Theionarchaea archaeon]
MRDEVLCVPLRELLGLPRIKRRKKQSYAPEEGDGTLSLFFTVPSVSLGR